jgi:hypothetical protein
MVRRRSSLLILLPLPGAEWIAACRSADGVVGGVALACARRVATIACYEQSEKPEMWKPGGLSRSIYAFSRELLAVAPVLESLACCVCVLDKLSQLPQSKPIVNARAQNSLT